MVKAKNHPFKAAILVKAEVDENGNIYLYFSLIHLSKISNPICFVLCVYEIRLIQLDSNPYLYFVVQSD